MEAADAIQELADMPEVTGPPAARKPGNYLVGGPTVFDAVGHQTVAKVRYTHDSMIDQIIKNPWISQNELAGIYGYSASWVSIVIASDAFQERLAARKDELIDPAIRATVEERFRGIVLQSLAVLQKKLEGPASQVDGNLALKVLDTGARALGFGARDRNAGGQLNVQFVVNVPGKAESSAAWEKQHTVTVEPGA